MEFYIAATKDPAITYAEPELLENEAQSSVESLRPITTLLILKDYREADFVQ